MAKPPSWNAIRSGATAFAARWEGVAEENAEAQSFWNEFLAIFGVDRRRVATFEARAQRASTGGRGRIDLLWPGTLVAEHKSAGQDLDAAEGQAMDYLESLTAAEFPSAVITSDFARIRIRDLGGDNEPYTFALADLPTEVDRLGFIAGYARRNLSPVQEQAANIAAARMMADLYERLAADGYTGHDASVFLTRLLFLLFGDDTGMWEKDLFTEYVQTRTSDDGSDVGGALAVLFQTLDREPARRGSHLDDLLARFPYVNGALFSARIDIPAFDAAMREELLTCCRFDWGAISPAIFGSMFQAVKSREARRVLGEHYTTERNILRVIQPLFLDGLRAELEAARHSKIRLERLRKRLGAMRYLDPACGCGNFLVVAYREMRAVELDILRAQRDLSGKQQLSIDATLDLQVSLDQFYGIEVEEWPARIAETAMFLVDHQANLALAAEFGLAPDRLPIRVAATIHHGNALRTSWQDLLPAGDDVLVFGNPPFIGSRMANEDQRADTDIIWAGNTRRGTLDYVTNWLRLSATYLAGTTGRAAFVATNSISQGEQPAVIWEELHAAGMNIDFAHRTFAWSSEAPGAAAVHVVIVGFSAAKVARRLWSYPDLRAEGHSVAATTINAYLIDGPDVIVRSTSRPLTAGVPKMLFGSMPRDGGHLAKISAEEAEHIREIDPVAARYLRQLIGSEEMLNGRTRYCLWLLGADSHDLATSPVLRTRLAAVRAMREASKAPSTRAAAATPALFVQLAQPSTRYLAVPRVSSETRRYLPTAFYEPDVIASDALLTVATDDLAVFGAMSSRAFTLWNATVSGRMKSDPRVSAEITYNNYPWPEADSTGRRAITVAATTVLDVRTRYPTSSLADLYNPLSMPPDLVEAHRRLDTAVLRDLGLTARADDAAVLTALFQRYQHLAVST